MVARAVSLSEDMSPLTAILTHHLTGHVDQPKSNNNNNGPEPRDDMSDQDRNKSDTDLARASTRHELYNILFAMLVGKWHEKSSVTVTGINDNLTEPHVDKVSEHVLTHVKY